MKAVPSAAGALGFPKVRQRVAVTQTGPCCPDSQSPAPVTRSAPSLSKIAQPQHTHRGIFTPSLSQQLNVPSGGRAPSSPWHLPPRGTFHPSALRWARSLIQLHPQRAITRPWGGPGYFKGALPLMLTQEMSLWCSCHPAGALPGPPCAQTPSHLLQPNIPPWLPGYLAGMCCRATCWEEARLSCPQGDPPE